MPEPVIESLPAEVARLRAVLVAIEKEIRLHRGGCVARIAALVKDAAPKH